MSIHSCFLIGLLEEADFYNLSGLVALCKEKLAMKPSEQKKLEVIQEPLEQRLYFAPKAPSIEVVKANAKNKGAARSDKI